MQKETQYRGGIADNGFKRRKTDFRLRRAIVERLTLLDSLHFAALHRLHIQRKDTPASKAWHRQQHRDYIAIARAANLKARFVTSVGINAVLAPVPRPKPILALARGRFGGS